MAAPASHAPREIELKLRAEPDALRQALAASGGEAPETRRTLRAVYFDTESQALRKAGISLRLRDEDGRRVQTIKARQADASLLERNEWESEVEGEAPDLGRAEGTPLAALLADEALRRALGPVFRVEVERVARTVAEGGSRIELVVDEGEVVAGERRAPVAEMELELKGGDPADLFRLARRLAEAAPLRLSLATKSEQGYALLHEGAPKVRKAEQAALRPGMSAAEAFQAIARACLRQVTENEAVLRAARAAEAVHQMRVGLRRLRAAISLFRPMLEDDALAGIRASLRSMAGALGAARDLDVFIAATLEPALAREPDDPGLKGLVADYRGRRDAIYDEVLATVESPGFRRGLLGALAWVESGLWLTGEPTRAARETPVVERAAEILERRARKVRRRGRGLVRMEAEERHQVRIEVKKLRYAVEFFGDLFRGDGARGRRRTMLEALQTLQASLGNLNDLAVGAGLAQAPAEGGLEAEALARLMAEDRGTRVDHLLAEAKAGFRSFRRAEPFWR